MDNKKIDKTDAEKMNTDISNDAKEVAHYSGQSFRFIVAAIVLMIGLSIATVVTFTIMMRLSTEVDEIQDENFEQHYVFIVDDKDSTFWKSVYESANAQAMEDHIYLEDLSETLGVNYTDEDLLRVAVNSSVDGIIYGGSASDISEAFINKAAGEGIGVAILQKDMESSARQCFVGSNVYELGQIYGSQILSALGKENIYDANVEILVDGDMSEGAVNILIMGIDEYVDAQVESEDDIDKNLNIEITRIYVQDVFSVDEKIRDIFLEREELPNIMICLSSIYTQCVYQAVVDYNKVGETSIIGYYADDSTIDAIEKQVIFSTVTVDTSEMGKGAVKALEEYHTHGYTNSFVSVGTEVYDLNNISSFKQSEEVEDND